MPGLNVRIKNTTMGEINGFSFYFQGEEYNALLYYRWTRDVPKLCVTIMNGELEMKFFGFHQFSMTHGKVAPLQQPSDPLVRSLQEIIVHVLQQHMDHSILTN